MKYKLFATDLDGTLLNDRGQISPRNQEAIRRIQNAGVHLVPATGRALKNTGMMNMFYDKDAPFVTNNGAIVAMHRSGARLFSATMEAALAAEIYRMGQARRIPVLMWAADGCLYTNEINQYSRLYQRAVGEREVMVISDIEALAEKGVVNIGWMDYPEQICGYQHELAAHFAGRVNCYATLPQLFEFVAVTASKAGGVARVGELLGVAPEEMVAVGDGFNDVSMLQYAGFSAAVANAPEGVKAVCDHVTLANNDDGIAELIDYLF